MGTSRDATFHLKQRIVDLENQLRDRPSFSMDRHIEAMERIAQLERLCQWAADTLRHQGHREAAITEVIDRLNKRAI